MLFPTVSIPSVHLVVASVPLLNGALPFPRFPLRPPYRRFHLAPSCYSGALPMLFHTLSRHLTLSSLPYRSFPTELSPSYFPRFPFRPPCRRFHLVVSSPQAIPHDFLSVHPIVASIWLLPNGALPVLFPTVSRPSTSSSLPHRSFPTRALPKLFPTASLPSTLSSLPSGPSRRNSPQAISHGFPSVHLVVASISLLPHGFLAKLFPTLSLPSALSSLPSRSFPIVLTELSPCYFPRFPVRPPSSLPSRSFPTELFPSYFRFPFLVVASVLLLPNELSPCYLRGFPFRPPCFHLAPSPRSSPQAVFHSFLSVHPISTLPYRSFPTELSPSYFPCFPLRPHIWSLPYRFFPMELSPSISHGFLPFTLSSLPYRSFPTELSPCYFPGFRSRPFTLSSLPYRSFPTELSPSYFPRFPFRPPCRRFHLQLLPHGALPSLFPTASPSATLSSLPSRCFPTELSPSYSPRFPLRPHIWSLPYRSFPTELSPCYFPFPPPCRRFRWEGAMWKWWQGGRTGNRGK